ncbi:hypothetical protein QF014_002274 [Pantoea agglomerans]|nr:hypothetical protein [Pantoea agglomerans]
MNLTDFNFFFTVIDCHYSSGKQGSSEKLSILKYPRGIPGYFEVVQN